ncbi:putative Monoacylglycerol lipase [Blattamonas nauphoetae]|uniref:Monoacylglycerol lipase n=1 Tax=Blattamonas nauphoetae TaxID=2049346 RepID=A0ABQ9Y632_9EUKA|nr:putative Monoacylglycerol lipase [Blattamonas nauphoetae]
MEYIPYTHEKMKLMSYRHHTPDAVGVAFVLHGLHEYAESHINTMKWFVSQGYSVFALDLEGHGRSVEGTPTGIMTDLSAVIDTWVAFAHEICKDERYVGKPAFLYGHSLGGTTGILVSRRCKDILNGSIISAPTIYINANKAATTFLPALSHVFKGMKIMELDRSTLAHDQEIGKLAAQDPFCTNAPVRAQSGRQMLLLTKEIQNHFDQDTYPLFVYHGKDDSLTPVKNTEMFFEGAASTDKTVHYFEDTYHEVHNEPCKEEMYRMIKEFMDKHPDKQKVEEPAPSEKKPTESKPASKQAETMEETPQEEEKKEEDKKEEEKKEEPKEEEKKEEEAKEEPKEETPEENKSE